MGRKRQETPEECTRLAHGLPLAWGGYILRPTDPKSGVPGVPNRSGIYGWHSRDGDLLYIGRSISMQSRLRKHHMPQNGGVFLSFREVPEKYLAGVEMAHIDTLDPLWNGAYESADLPFWGEMCEAIAAAWSGVWPEMSARVRAKESALIEQIAARL